MSMTLLLLKFFSYMCAHTPPTKIPIKITTNIFLKSSKGEKNTSSTSSTTFPPHPTHPPKCSKWRSCARPPVLPGRLSARRVRRPGRRSSCGEVPRATSEVPGAVGHGGHPKEVLHRLGLFFLLPIPEPPKRTKKNAHMSH